jgi:hypothetical protein
MVARVGVVVAAVVALGGWGCDGPLVEAPSPEPPKAEVRPVFSEARQMVPSAALPASLVLDEANNNLDIARFDGRLFLAWRTAPNHFASPDARLIIASTTDEVSFTVEADLNLDTDVREPRLCVVGGKLFLYFAVLGRTAVDFEPEGMMLTSRGPDGAWAEPEWFYEPGYIPWRTRVIDGVPYMLTYGGGENIYGFERPPLEIRWLTTADGVNWTPVVPGQPTVSTGGGSEADFALLDDGGLVAVIRNEAGDELGYGSKICRAEAGRLGDWTCKGDRRKYDSPIVFRHGADVWLIARRNITKSGYYQLDDPIPAEDPYLNYQLTYWQTPKRCSLWRVDPDTLTVTWAGDLASQGDTCFAGVVDDGEDGVIVYNYSSPIDGSDPSWLVGQLAPTHIYRQRLSFLPVQ